MLDLDYKPKKIERFREIIQFEIELLVSQVGATVRSYLRVSSIGTADNNGYFLFYLPRGLLTSRA